MNLLVAQTRKGGKKDDTFRVMKKGRKTAVRVLPSLEEAEKYIEGSDVANLSIEHSKGICKMQRLL